MIFFPLTPLLEQDRPIRLIWLALGSVPVAEAAAQSGADAVVLDLQHGLWERNTLDAATALAGKHVPVIARCIDASPHHLSQALDAGAASVLVPLIETAEQARASVLASHYPPKGHRSAGGVRPLFAGVPGMLDAGRRVTVGIMIETVKGVENIEDIVQVPGIDYLFVGTGDLALSRGADDAEAVERDCQRVLAAARAQGIPCGIYAGTQASAAQAYAGGYRLAVAAADVDVLREGFVQAAQCLEAQP